MGTSEASDADVDNNPRRNWCAGFDIAFPNAELKGAAKPDVSPEISRKSPGERDGTVVAPPFHSEIIEASRAGYVASPT